VHGYDVINLRARHAWGHGFALVGPKRSKRQVRIDANAGQGLTEMYFEADGPAEALAEAEKVCELRERSRLTGNDCTDALVQTVAPLDPVTDMFRNRAGAEARGSRVAHLLAARRAIDEELGALVQEQVEHERRQETLVPPY
jgi:hypothetical protein